MNGQNCYKTVIVSCDKHARLSHGPEDCAVTAQDDPIRLNRA